MFEELSMTQRLVRIALLGFCCCSLSTRQANGSLQISTTNMQTVVSSTPFPGTSGTHTHTALGSPVDVGSWLTSEDMRGLVEFALAGQSQSSTTTLSFIVNQLAGTSGQTGPGNYQIDIVGYLGNNSITTSDYTASSIGLIGTFNTASLVVGQTLSFDATSAFNFALLNGGSLGVRLQSSTNPGSHVANEFRTFQLDTTPQANVPEPFSILVWVGLACAATTVAHRRSFSRN